MVYDNLTSRQILAEAMINDCGRKTISLNGIWEYMLDPKDIVLRGINNIFTKETIHTVIEDCRTARNWQKMKIPGNWNKEGINLFNYEGKVAFYKEFTFNQTLEDKRIFLNFGSVNEVAYIFLNDNFLGTHTGGYTPFFIDITDYIQNNNVLFVVADNYRHEDMVPNENAYWFNYGGLSLDVNLVLTPKVYLKDFKTTLVQDGSFSNIEVLCSIGGMNLSDGVSSNNNMNLSDLYAEFSIKELKICQEISLQDEGKGSVVITADKLKLWSPDSPKLYKVQLLLKDKKTGKLLDSICDTVGYRQLWLEGKYIELNGKRFSIKGLSSNLFRRKNETGYAYKKSEAARLIKKVKALGCNCIKLEDYPFPKILSELADKYGLFLWEEIPVCNDLMFSKQSVYKNAENQLKELINRDYNRASVMTWFIGHASKDTDERLLFMTNLAMKVQELDKTRYIAAECNINPSTESIDDRLKYSLDIICISGDGINKNLTIEKINKTVEKEEIPVAFTSLHNGEQGMSFIQFV